MVLQQTQDITYIIADVNSRVRTLESKYNLLGERLLVINQNMIEEYKKVIKEMRMITSDIRELKAEMSEVKSAVKNVVLELDLFARKESVKVIDKYLKLWSPLQFTTEEQVTKMIDERMGVAKKEAKWKGSEHQ